MRKIKFKAIAADEFYSSHESIKEGQWVYGLPGYDDRMWVRVQTEENPAATVEVDIKIRLETISQLTGLTDKFGVHIYANDILKDYNEQEMRVYATSGGFGIKENYWRSDQSDLIQGDELILLSLAYPQIQSFIFGNCAVIRNHYDK